MNTFNNLKIGVKLTGSFLLVALIIVVVAGVGYVNMKSINDGMTSLYFDRTLPIEQLGLASAQLYKLRGDIYRAYIQPSVRATLDQTVADDIAAIDKQMDAYRATYLVQEEKDELAKFDSAWLAYQPIVAAYVAAIKAGDAEAAAAIVADTNTTTVRQTASIPP